MTLKQLVDFLTVKPAETFGLDLGRLEPGKEADLVVIDLEKSEKIDPENFLSKGKNTPFAGWDCKGWPVLTMVKGKIVWDRETVKA